MIVCCSQFLNESELICLQTNDFKYFYLTQVILFNII